MRFGCQPVHASVTRGTLLALCAVGLAACVLPTHIESRVSEAASAADDATSAAGAGVVIYPESRCMARALQARLPRETDILDSRVFRNSLFPWFEPAHLPASPADMRRLLERPGVRETLVSLDARFFVQFTESQRVRENIALLTCGGTAYAGVGCAGLHAEEHTVTLAVLVWDLASGRQSLSMDATATGDTWVFGLGIPIGLWADAQGQACREVAGQIARRIRDQAG